MSTFDSHEINYFLPVGVFFMHCMFAVGDTTQGMLSTAHFAKLICVSEQKWEQH